MPPPDKDSLSDRDLLIRLDERSEARTGQLDRIERGQKEINGRVRKVETEQAAMKGRSNAFDAILAAATVIGTTLGITVKQ